MEALKGAILSTPLYERFFLRVRQISDFFRIEGGNLLVFEVPADFLEADSCYPSFPDVK